MNDQAYHLLIDKLGFSNIEAMVYLCLCKDYPQTGYKISTTINKSRSSTYQALKALESRQAIIRLEATQFSEYIPVKIEEYMAQQEKEFIKQKEEIINSFKDVTPNTQEDYIYQILKTDQLYNKIEMMLSEAKSMILIDTDEKPLNLIKSQLIHKAKEGVHVMIETPGNIDVEHCYHVSLKSFSPKDFDWNADWLCISIDGEQFLISLLDKNSGELIHAIWCGNQYISPWIYNGMLHEFSFRQMLAEMESLSLISELKEKMKPYIDQYFQPVSGFRRLQEKLIIEIEKLEKKSGGKNVEIKD